MIKAALLRAFVCVCVFLHFSEGKYGEVSDIRRGFLHRAEAACEISLSLFQSVSPSLQTTACILIFILRQNIHLSKQIFGDSDAKKCLCAQFKAQGSDVN